MSEPMQPADVPVDLMRAANQGMYEAILMAYETPPDMWFAIARNAVAAVLPLHERQLRERAETAEDELARQRKANRDVAKQCMDAMEQATTAKRKLAEMRERIGELGDEWSYETQTRYGWRRCSTTMTEEYARKRAADSGRNRLVHRKAGEWKVADGGQ